MNELMIGLAAAGAGFILLSFFVPNRERRIEQELEELSMKMLQEHYQFKQKLRVIEEELLIGDPTPSIPVKTVQKPSNGVNEIIKSQVRSLHRQGVAVPQIAAQSSLTPDQVTAILKEQSQ